MTPSWPFLPPRPRTAADVRAALIALMLVPAVASSEATAALLRHTIQESDSAESLQLGGVCMGLKRTPARLLCLPFPQLIEEQGRLALDLAVKVNDRAYVIANRILDRDVDQELLDELFTDQNFQSVSGAATLRAAYRATSLNFTPLHAVGALKLTNPSLPEVHVAGMKQSVLRLTHNFLFRSWFLSKYGDLLLTPSAFYYDRKFAYLDVDLVSSSGQDFASLVESQQQKSADADLALAFLSRSPYVPTLSIRAENILHDAPCPDCDERFFDIKRPLGATASVGMNFFVPHPIGYSLVGGVLPFFGPFRQYDQLKTTVAYAYRLSKLGCFATFSPLIHTFGFLFDSEVYRLGILYSDEQYDNAHHIGRLKQTYVFTSFYL